MKVATLGAEYGWMFATGSEQRRLFAALAETCETANALGCDTIMSATGQGSGSVREAAAAPDLTHWHPEFLHCASSLRRGVTNLLFERSLLPAGATIGTRYKHDAG